MRIVVLLLAVLLALPAASRELKSAVEHLELLESMNPDPKVVPNALISNTYQTAAEHQKHWNALVPSERTHDDPREPLAVIVDVDETVLDNTPYQARMIKADKYAFDVPMWSAWVEERRARALPGAREFAEQAKADGVTIFYVTNRDGSKLDPDQVERVERRIQATLAMIEGDPEKS